MYHDTSISPCLGNCITQWCPVSQRTHQITSLNQRVFTVVYYSNKLALPSPTTHLKNTAVNLLFTHPLRRYRASSGAGEERPWRLHSELRGVLYSSWVPLEDTSSALAVLPSTGGPWAAECGHLRTTSLSRCVDVTCAVSAFSPDDVAYLIIEAFFYHYIQISPTERNDTVFKDFNFKNHQWMR